MDWSKSKNILIVALLATNLFLLAVLIDVDGLISDSSVDETMDFLESQGIFLAAGCSIPTNTPKEMSKLTVEYGENPSAEEVERAKWYQTPLPENPSEEDYRLAADSFLARLGIPTEAVEYHDLIETETGYIVKYRNFYGGYALEESYMKCFFEGDMLVDFDRLWLEPQKKENKIEIVDAEKVLRWFVSQEVSDQDRETETYYLNSIELVYSLGPDSYHPSETSLTTDTAFPYWKVTYNEGEIWMSPAFEE